MHIQREVDATDEHSLVKSAPPGTSLLRLEGVVGLCGLWGMIGGTVHLGLGEGIEEAIVQHLGVNLQAEISCFRVSYTKFCVWGFFLAYM